EYARGFGRGISPEVNDRFVRMYVNQDTRELPADGVRALEELYLRAVAAGVIPRAPAVTII
ncbi:MAG: ABC transporter substrate-binding protein, partial [bacterium]